MSLYGDVKAALEALSAGGDYVYTPWDDQHLSDIAGKIRADGSRTTTPAMVMCRPAGFAVTGQGSTAYRPSVLVKMLWRRRERQTAVHDPYEGLEESVSELVRALAKVSYPELAATVVAYDKPSETRIATFFDEYITVALTTFGDPEI